MKTKDGVDFLIRHMAGDDLPDVQTLLGGGEPKALPQGTYTLVAELENEIVGVIRCLENNASRVVTIQHVVVKQAFRRRLIGMTLVDYVIQSLHDRAHGDGWSVEATTDQEDGAGLMAKCFDGDSHPNLIEDHDEKKFTWRLRK